MAQASLAGSALREIRRRTAILAVATGIVALLDLGFLAVPVAGTLRVLLAAVAILAEAGALWLVGDRYVGGAVRAGLAALDGAVAEAEVRRQNSEQLASAGRVAAGIAHEIGNPLCAIVNYAHLLDGRVEPELRDTVRALQREAARIERNTDGFSDHARPREPGHIGADVNEAVASVLAFLGEQGVIRRIDIDRQLDSQPLPVAASALQLEQTFSNVVLNASDAMAGGGRLCINTRRVPRTSLVDASMRRAADRPADGLASIAGPPPVPRPRNEPLHQWVADHSDAFAIKIVFADSGHGVARGDEDRIFEPFVTTKPRERGTGLGLSVVRRLVESVDGLVWVQPSREGGAAFHVVFPVYVVPAG